MNALEPARIRALINNTSRTRLDALEVFAEIGSTNSFLLGEPRPAAGRHRVVFAEHQTHGRGRRDRVWVSPPSTGLCTSMAFTFQNTPRDLPSLSLAVGIGIAQALERLGIHGIGLKWPNDIVAGNGKLGGVLLEVHAAKGDGLTVVVGVGLNIDLGKSNGGFAISTSFGQATDLAANIDELPSRDKISAALIDALVETMLEFQVTGFSTFLELWPNYDWLRGREVNIESAGTISVGVAQGVDADGALLLRTGGEMQRVSSGTVNFRERTGTDP